MFSRLWCKVLLAAGLLLSLPAGLVAAELLEPPTVTPLSPASVVISWQTSVPTGSRVLYGEAAGRLGRSVSGSGEITARHRVTLEGLTPGTRYFFAVGTARRSLAQGDFVTARSPLARQAPVSTSPASAPPATAPPKSLVARLFELILPGAPPAPGPTTAAPPSRHTWGHPASLRDHFVRHGGDFASRSAEDYAAQAWYFRQRARSGQLLVKVDEAGVQRVYEPATDSFAAYNPDGTTRTFFKPGGRDYFARQPGRLVRAVTP